MVDASVESRELMVPDNFLPAIDEDVKDQVLKDAEDVTLWMKPTPGGFLYDDRTLPEIVGVITRVDRYWVLWTDGQPEKVHQKESPGDEFELRCDLEITTSTGQKLGVSLAQSSYKKNYAPYAKGIKDMGYDPEEVFTRFTCKEVNGRFGVFTVVRPEMVEPLKRDAFSPEEVHPDIVNVPDDDIPF